MTSEEDAPVKPAVVDDAVDDYDPPEVLGESDEGDEGVQRATSYRTFVDDQGPIKGNAFFLFMARMPVPFMLILPVAFCFLLGFGWTTNDKIEQEVADLWIAEDGSYAKDLDYASSIGVEDLGSTSYAALAISRDGGNMLTAERLALVRDRMEAAEGTEIDFMGNTYTWDDLCSVTTAPYQFPCLRLSPMDLYEEARWTFTLPDQIAWYRSIVQDTLVAPRLARFGALTTTCGAPCAEVVDFRFATGDALLLFADVGNLEYNDVCKICLEASYTGTIETLHAGIALGFGGLRQQLLAFGATLDDSNSTTLKADVQLLADNLGTLAQTVTKNDVTEFYNYYVTRGLYAQLGAESYMENYQFFGPAITDCEQAAQVIPNTVCPLAPANLTLAIAGRDLFNHADGTFSSVTTAGAPFPFWSEADGTGVLFQGNSETGGIFPVSGSGVNMAGDIMSLGPYLNTTGGLADPESEAWQTEVEINPLYAWFMASLTPAEAGTVCNNGNLTGTPLDPSSAGTLAAASQSWCTPFDVPNANKPGTGGYSKQHFARLWYDLLIASPGFLGVTQGQDDPYSWTTGAGCGYSLGGSRFSYTGQNEEDILGNSSGIVYNIDEGVSLGPMDAHLLLGGVTPPVGDYSPEKPLKEVKVLQSLYAALLPADIIKRVQNCNRPGGQVVLTEDEATDLLIAWKEAMEENWNKGWEDEDDGPVEFVSFFDDGGGAIGSTGRMLTEITLDNSTLTAISIVIISLFSAAFLFSTDLVESRVLVTLVGVGLVVLSFFSSLGFGLLTGVQINVTIAWTLPFVIIGLGVDDVYIVLLALKNQGGYSLRHWLRAMKEVVVPVTMTSLVNASMFAVLNISDIPAIYLTSRVALYCIIALYLSVIFCFPAYCLLDLQRQENNRLDMLFCLTSSNDAKDDFSTKDIRNTVLYDYFYKPIVLGETGVRRMCHAVIILLSVAMFAVGCWGVTERQVGLGLEDFFPEDNPAGRWAEIGTKELASWSIAMNWGPLNYTDASTQMKMVKQFEDVVADPRIGEMDTKQLWMAEFLVWTTRHCDENFARSDFETLLCGRDQVDPDSDSICSGMWVENEFGLREKNIASVTSDVCIPYEGGICRPGTQMHPGDLADMALTPEAAQDSSFCPVVGDWSDDKWQFCLGQWRNITGGSGRLLTEPGTATATTCSGVDFDDDTLLWPMPYSYSPTMFAFDVFTHEQTLDMMRATRSFCDDNEEIRCWLTGIPYDYWTQYLNIFDVLLELSGYAVLAGFTISFVFLFAKLAFEARYPIKKVFFGSLIGAGLIGCTMLLTLTTVIGFSLHAGVNLTGFSNMSFVLSIGFTVEYTVHVISRWMRASMNHKTSLDRVGFTMEFLMLPTFMSFVSSTIGTICLAFTEFEFNHKFFFRPLIIVMFVSYWYGCWFLPTVLTYLDFDVVKLGKPATVTAAPPSSLMTGELDLKEEVGEVTNKDGSDEPAPDKAADP